MGLTRTLSGVFLLCLLVGCATRYTVDVAEGAFNGLRLVRLRGNVLPQGSVVSSGELELNLERVDRPDTFPEFAFLLEYVGSGLRIDREAPLLLASGSDTLRLAPDSIFRPWPRPDRSDIDQVRYSAGFEELQGFARESEAAVIARIGPWTERRVLSPENLGHLLRFVEAHVPRDSAAARVRPLRPPPRNATPPP